jgi:hypothetical protein
MSRDYRVIAEALLVERASFDVIKALRQGGVRPILLKGPLQQWWLEAGGPPRASSDVDVLVSLDQFESAEAALSAVGLSRSSYFVEPGIEHHSIWEADDHVPVELHWTLVGVDESKVWDVLSRETETAVLMGEPVEIPNEAARCLIVALHAAHHGAGVTAIVDDIEKALVVAGTETWRRAFELAAAVGGWTAFAGALSLTPRGRELLAKLGASPPVLGERQALSLLTPAPTSVGFYFLARERGVSAKAAFVLRELVPPPEFIRLSYPDYARRGPAGLAIAYCIRLFWLVRWAPSGLRSWSAARRLAEATRANARERGQDLDSPQAREPEDANGSSRE